MTRSNNTTQPGNRAVGYVRRSTDRQEQSIPDQKKALQDYATEHGFRLIKFYVDDAISGTSTLGRRAFQQMIRDAESPTCRFDIIVVYDVKRFGRVDNDVLSGPVSWPNLPACQPTRRSERRTACCQQMLIATCTQNN